MTTSDDQAREEAAMLYANGDSKAAVDFLIAYLNQHAKTAPTELWLMLMEIYQAQRDQASFERLAGIFAQRFQRSPPSWPHGRQAAPVRMGRNVLVLDGPPTQITPSRWRDFLASARESDLCRLDLSRVRLPDGVQGFEAEVEALLQLMDRLNRQKTRVMLMGDGALQDRLGRDIEDWPVAGPRRAAMRLLLGLLQWRGQEDAFEDLAMRFADDYQASPPGYEPRLVLAKDNPEPEQGPADHVMEEEDVPAWTEALLDGYRRTGRTEVDFRQFDRLTYPAALALSRWFDQQQINPRHVVFRGVNHLLRALFDNVALSDLVTYEQRLVTT